MENSNGDKKVMNLRLDNLEAFVEKHIAWHEKQSETSSKRNWQLWVILITIFLTNAAGSLIAKLVAG